MFAFIQHDTPREHRRLLVAGVFYVALMVVFMTFCSAAYLKYFHPVTWVTIEADRAGLQLPKYGDVRMHGVIIGQVRDISQRDGKARIKLGLEREAARVIPTNAEVAIKPTTLFGQKYVEFIDPPSTASGPVGLADGTVIASNRVRTTVELDRILARLSTILTTVRPQDVNATLHAVATALSGNGDDLGRSLDKLDTYLGTMNPYLPTLRKDLEQLAEVADTYAVAAPDLIDMLDNVTTSARTLKEKDDEFGDLLTGVAGLSTNATALLRENEEAIEVEGTLAIPLLKMLELYAPEYPCVLKGLDKTIDGLDQIFRNSRVYQTMAFSGTQRPAYRKIDRPEWNWARKGPWCLGLPDTPIVGIPPIGDGTEDNPAQHFQQGFRR